MVVVASDGGLVEPHDVGIGIQLRRRVRRPLEAGASVDLRRTVEQHPPRRPSVVGDHHPGAAAGRGQRRLKPRRTRPRDQHVAMVKALLVRVPAGSSGRSSKARHPADEPSVEVPPAGRPHERLVVEPGREQRRQPVVDRPQVEADARPAVDAACAQAVPEQEGRRPCVGLVVVAIELHDGVGLLGPGGDDPPRAVVLEAAADQTHAVGHQGGGEGVTRVALVDFPVEPKMNPAGTINECPARGETERLRANHRRIDSIRPLACTEASRLIAGSTPSTPRTGRRRLPTLCRSKRVFSMSRSKAFGSQPPSHSAISSGSSPHGLPWCSSFFVSAGRGRSAVPPRFSTRTGGGGFEAAPGSRTRPRIEATRR